MINSGHTSTYNHIEAGRNSRQHNGDFYGNITNNYNTQARLGATNRARAKPRQAEYTVGWICALPVPEWQASRMLFDKEHPNLDLPGTKHAYAFGEINGHNVVMGCLPDTQMGESAAASAASEMSTTFPSLRFGLLVGVGGGVWSSKHDVRLGDVVVSRPDPNKRNGGVIQYDFGKALQGRGFQQTGSLNLPPTLLLTTLGKVRAQPPRQNRFYDYLRSYEVHKDDNPEYAHRPTTDILFKSDYVHQGGEDTCLECDLSKERRREDNPVKRPMVHYGTIASGNQVIKDAIKRDEIAQQHDILCFEMEAAGLMNQFHCLVVRGICDYCDSHKNKKWQPYAAAAAASWAKEFLRNIPPQEVDGQDTVEQQVEQ